VSLFELIGKNVKREDVELVEQEGDEICTGCLFDLNGRCLAIGRDEFDCSGDVIFKLKEKK